MADQGTSNDPTNGTPAGDNNDVKPKPLKIKIMGQGMPELTIQVKRSTKLAKVFGAYATRASKQVGELLFLFDGERLSESATIDSLGIEDDDEEVMFDVMQHQVGGSC